MLQSLNATLEALAQSSGEVWLGLITIVHPQMAMPMRLATPTFDAIVSDGNTFTPARADVVISPENADGPATAQVVIDAVDGTLLAALKVLRSSPLIDIAVVTLSEPDIVQTQVRKLQIAKITVEGVRAMTFQLASKSITQRPFPSKRMSRANNPGIFTDL